MASSTFLRKKEGGERRIKERTIRWGKRKDFEVRGVFRRLEKRLYDVRSPSRGKIALYAPLALYVTARIRVNSKAREPVRFLFIGKEKRERKKGGREKKEKWEEKGEAWRDR